ncbi:hypothetical protein Ancab_017337 [Ancistrocladus abbreviatus]
MKGKGGSEDSGCNYRGCGANGLLKSDYKMESCNNSATTNTTTTSATISCSDFIITTSNHFEVCIPEDIWKKIENHTGKQLDGKHETKYDRIAGPIEESTLFSPSKKPRAKMTDVVVLNDGGAPEDKDYFLNFSFDVNELIDATDAGPVLPYPDAKWVAPCNVHNDLAEDLILRINESGFINWTEFGL